MYSVLLLKYKFLGQVFGVLSVHYRYCETFGFDFWEIFKVEGIILTFSYRKKCKIIKLISLIQNTVF